MKRLVFMACAACGGATASGGETPIVVVPTQPPQPVASAGPAASAPVVDAGAAGADVPFECKTGKRFEVGPRSYCAYSDALPWDAAEHRCVENGGHLATFDSRTTSEALRKALTSPLGLPRAAWIGLELRKVGAKKEWRWTNGSSVVAPAWSTGEPNDFYGDGSEACAEWLVADGKWNDTRCDLRLPVLCQRTASQALRCVTPPAQAFEADGFGYCLDPQPRTFAEAKKACAQAGGTIAGPLGEAENHALREALAARFSATRFWIGLTDAAEEGTWTWASGARFDFRDWHRGEPNDYLKEDCVEVYADTWKWNDFDCSAPKASVCESAPKKK